MKRFIAIIVAVLSLLALTACGSNAGETNKEIDIDSVKSKIISDLSIEGAMDVDAGRLIDLYGIEEKDIEKSACYVTMDGVFPDEIVMIKATDADAAKRIEEKLNKRLEEVKVQFESYDAENYALAQECKVIKEGNYVALFLSAKHADMEKIFQDAAK